MIKKITSTQHKSTFLRLLHGDVYTNERLTRFGLRDDPECDQCGQIDTLEHRLTECQRTLNLIVGLERISKKLRQINFNYEDFDTITRLTAAYRDSDVTTVTLHAEVLKHIIFKNDTPENIIIENLIARTLSLESNEKIKNKLRALLAD